MNQTLHDWLLDRHRDANPQLDAIRRSTLAPPPMNWKDLLGGLFYPHRVAWASLTLVWLILVALHVAMAPPPPPASPHVPPNVWSDRQFASAFPDEALPTLDGHF